MKVLRLVLVGVIAMFAAAPRVEAQATTKLQPGIGLVGGNAPLLTPDAVEKLKLTAEQKDKYGKIEGDYKEKTKTIQDGFRTILQGGGDRKEAIDKMQTDLKKIREDSLAKVEPLLTGEQKTVFTQVKVQQPQPGGGIRPVPPIAIGGGIGQVLPAGVQQRLQLTDEQKKQIEAIQKEVEAKVMKVLTDEQKKQLEGMKKGPIIRPAPGIQPLPIQIQPRNVNPPAADPARKD
jgi:Spy/CpxP family protein refolding chaperone